MDWDPAGGVGLPQEHPVRGTRMTPGPAPAGAGGRNPWKDFRGDPGVPKRSLPMYRRRTRRRCWRARGRGRRAKLSFATPRAHGEPQWAGGGGHRATVLSCRLPGDGIETEAALTMLDTGPHRTEDHGRGRQGVRHGGVRDATCRSFRITPHVAMKQRHSALDRRTSRIARGVRGESARRAEAHGSPHHTGEEVFGWLKTVGGGSKLRYCGVARNGHWAEMALAAYNLVRMAKLMPPPSSSPGRSTCGHRREDEMP